jgi:hypothetical protein
MAHQGAHLTKATFASALTSATQTLNSVHMVMDFGAQGQHLTMNADMSMNGASASDASLGQALKQISMSMSMVVPGKGTVAMRLVKGVMYVSASGQGIPASAKPWTKFDLNDPNNPFGSMFGNLASMSPTQMGQAFRSISTLRNLGPAVADGIETTHYVVTIDTSKVADLMGVPAGTDLSSLPATLTYNVWLDASSRPVEMATSISGTTMQMHFSKWNEPVHVVAPPASQVTTTK